MLEEWRVDLRSSIIEDGTKTSYSDLFKEIANERTSLRAVAKQFQPFVLEAEHGVFSYAKFLALLAEAIPVHLCPSYQFQSTSYRQILIEQNQTDFVFCSLEQSLADALVCAPSTSYRVHPLFEHSQLKHFPSFIVRTSGSTGGTYKYILHRADRFIAKFKNRVAHFQKTLAFSPLESIAGIETLLETLVLGRTLVIPSQGISPVEVSRAIESHKIDYFQTTPTMLTLMLLSGVIVRDRFSLLKKIAYGSEPSALSTMLEIRDRLPDVDLKHTYGMSEIGILETRTCPGDPTMFALDKSLNPGRIRDGLLEVQSQSTMVSYLNKSHQLTPDGWFQTMDSAVQVGDYMKVVGRLDDTINIAGRKFHPSELETLIAGMENVADVTVIKEKSDLVGEIIVAEVLLKNFEPEDGVRARFKRYSEKTIPYFMHPQKLILLGNLSETGVNSRLKKIRVR